ncbi:hypothetical protein [Curtobacterium sp. KT1]|uniref:hypothetical protein n=1 Tax=Curtobacterium sp. KT1 TaxID=3372858 RepID=UPI0037BEEC4C
MASSELEPVEVIALEMALADLHYVSTALVGRAGDVIAAEIALVQYGAMAAYEAQLHFNTTLGWTIDPGWDAATAKAARMSGKFFADTKRNLDGVVAHFEDLLAANHGAFYPPDRRGKLFDFLRDDLSVVTVDARPYTSLLSAHYLTGLAPTQTATLGEAGPVVRKLAFGIGQVAATLLDGAEIPAHPPTVPPAFEWWDTKSGKALPRLFAGQLQPALGAALMTVHSVLMSAAHSEDRIGCAWCRTAAKKHRFVALFQTLTALKILQADAPDSVPPKVTELLDEADSQWVLAQRRLRNGLVHLGMQDVREKIRAGDDAAAAFAAYTGGSPNVDARVITHTARVLDVLTDWMLTPPQGGKTFESALRRYNPTQGGGF